MDAILMGWAGCFGRTQRYELEIQEHTPTLEWLLRFLHIRIPVPTNLLEALAWGLTTRACTARKAYAFSSKSAGNLKDGCIAARPVILSGCGIAELHNPPAAPMVSLGF